MLSSCKLMCASDFSSEMLSRVVGVVVRPGRFAFCASACHHHEHLRARGQLRQRLLDANAQTLHDGSLKFVRRVKFEVLKRLARDAQLVASMCKPAQKCILAYRQLKMFQGRFPRIFRR